MLPKTFLTTVLLAVTITAKPVVFDKAPVSLALSRRVNATGVHKVLARDQARARLFKSGGPSTSVDRVAVDAVINEPVDNQAFSYIASVGVGNPPTNYQLIIDTGSSNTWIGADKKYIKTSSSKKTPDRVSVSYGSGSFSGTEYIDRVTLGDGLVIAQQSIGVASSATGFDGVDGILGIGPVGLTVKTLSPDRSSPIPTLTDNLFANGVIDNNLIGIYYEPTTSQESQNGVLTWGGINTNKTTSSVDYIPITSNSPSSDFWGIDQSIRYGRQTILSTTSGIVDTGTTLILIATDAYDAYASATGATADSTTGLLKITLSQYSNLESLFFEASGNTYELVPNAQIWPRALNSILGGTADAIYLVVGDLGSESGQGLDFINGYAFLERFYSVYDTANNQVGFATTKSTKSKIN